MKTAFVVDEAKIFLEKATREMATAKSAPTGKGRAGARKAESPLRHMFSAALPQMFPDRPWWVEHHATMAETHVSLSKEGKKGSGFVDTLVGLTPIEYEKDLTDPAIFKIGYEQVKGYCAGLLNQKCREDLIIGILSDTIRWRIYRIAKVDRVKPASGTQTFGPEHIHLEEIDSADLSAASTRDGKRLGEIMTKYLGREGTRPLGAVDLAKDLGITSPFCNRHIRGIESLVDLAFTDNKGYADLITKLWEDFVFFLGDKDTAGTFDRNSYVEELYILTLAKLLCANVLEGKALASDDGELISILDGGFFKNRGFTNLVEYDYFGWLNQPPYVEKLLPVARELQDDLRAYDFTSPPEEDLFGVLLSQLAVRSKRILLGQECTPAWLAEKLVRKVLDELPEERDPAFVDMCCGSGTMVVEAVKLAKKRLEAKGIKPNIDSMNRLSRAITGFDIDPLAVMLAKISWTLAARTWVAGSGVSNVSIPIYHADSMFAVTPLSQTVDPDLNKPHRLLLDNKTVVLPGFLLSSERRILFDALLDRGYEMAMASARKPKSTLTDAATASLVVQTIDDVSGDLSEEEKRETIVFCRELIVALEALQRAGRNGIWAFVLRNSYRPGLVAGQFNGLVSNPPWLALSKVADNPYSEALKSRAESYGVKPKGAAFLHIELATIFLLHAVERYLEPEAAVGCVLPETILNGEQHKPLRQAGYLKAQRPVPFWVDEIWRVEKGTFKNEAAVLIGKKKSMRPTHTTSIPGMLVNSSGRVKPLTFQTAYLGKHYIWTDMPVAHGGLIPPSNWPGLHEGADIMPRTLVFHECVQVDGTDRWNILPIDRTMGTARFLVKGAKKYKEFKITVKGVDGRFLFDVLQSNHLIPFHINMPAKGFLPIEKNGSRNWISVSETDLAAFGTATSHAFKTILSATKMSSAEYFGKLDSNRRKLSSQVVPSEGWLVFRGAGGNLACAAYANAQAYSEDKLIIDQTLYWTVASTEDEAIYLTGLFNSEAIKAVIVPFQPCGSFGERHIHKLADQITPRYDAENEDHADVVEKTKSLLSEWRHAEGTDPRIQKLFDPNAGSLPSRRSKARKILKKLAAYPAYDRACRKLYGI